MFSMEGRVTLTKVVLQAYPTYVMLSTFLSFSLCDAIDRNVAFLCGVMGIILEKFIL